MLSLLKGVLFMSDRMKIIKRHNKGCSNAEFLVLLLYSKNEFFRAFLFWRAIFISLSMLFLYSSFKGEGYSFEVSIILSLTLIFVANLISQCIVFLMSVNPEEFALKMSRLFKLFIKYNLYISASKFVRKFSEKQVLPESLVTVDDITTVLSYGVDTSKFDERNIKNLKKVLDFNNSSVRDSMRTHRTRVVGINQHLTLKEAKQIVIENEFDYYPLYERDLDSIFGIIHRDDLLAVCMNNLETETVKEVVKWEEVFRILKSQPAASTLLKMRQSGIYFCVVTDEYGGTEGILTLEDLLDKVA